jgi:glycosyltransferase involved in cell wall biosynthesis
MHYDAVFLFRGDIRYDTRLGNFVSSYTGQGKSVLVIQGATESEKFTYNGAEVISFPSTEKGPRGFLLYWIRSSKLSSSYTASAYWASDLYSLPVAVWRARKTKGNVAYDSRELFAHLGALKKSPYKQKFWYGLEKFLLRYTDAVVTSGQMDSEYMEERYGIEFPCVVRNVPRYQHVEWNERLRTELGIGEKIPICLYIGGLQEGRGVPIVLQLAEAMPDCAFVFIGSGVMGDKVKEAAAQRKNVFHIPHVPNTEVLSYAAAATLGLALIEPITLSYFLALPNKLFEYIMAGTPVIGSYVPQIEKIILDYKVGVAVPYNDFDAVLNAIREVLGSQELYGNYAHNCRHAAQDLCWEKEEQQFIGFAKAKGLL